MAKAVEFSARALEHVEDVGAVAKVLSAHVRETAGRSLSSDVIVRGRRIRYRVDEEQITVLEARPVKHSDS